jgi:hypothetical protein
MSERTAAGAERRTKRKRNGGTAPATDPRAELVAEAEAIDPRLAKWLAKLLNIEPDLDSDGRSGAPARRDMT